MSNLSSYCGLVDAKIRASDKDLPVTCSSQVFTNPESTNHKVFLFPFLRDHKVSFFAKVLKQLQTCRKTKQRNCIEKNREFVDSGFVTHGIGMKAKLKKKLNK